MWFDQHCHLTSLRADPDQAVAAATEAGVTHLVTVGTSVADSVAAAEVAARHPNVWSTAGVHPHYADQGLDGLDDALDGDGVVAVGECGLDFHYNRSSRQAQLDVFRAHIARAHERDLALIIHTREAWEETFDILDAEGTPNRTVFHCFTGGPDEAQACLERGGWLSYSGIVTFATAEELRAAARLTPLDKLLIETDSPYLTPEPHRGTPNQPARVAVVGEFLADLLGHQPDELAAATMANTATVYGLDHLLDQ